jgi:SAM-dependent methyltransferase
MRIPWPFAISQATHKRFYASYNGPAQRLYGLIREQVPTDSHVLDIGAGYGYEDQRRLDQHFAKLCGVDVDPAVLQNKTIHEARLIEDDGKIPYPDNTFDAALSDYVLEHVQDPHAFMTEVARVLKPGGKLYFRTVNRWYYLAIATCWMPRNLSCWLADKLGHAPGGSEHTYPTYMRLNSINAIRRHAEAASLELGLIERYETPPVYFRLCAPLWWVGLALERTLNAVPALAFLRANLVGRLDKPQTDETREN